MKTAKLFQNGGSQAVRLPKEFRFEGKEVFIKRMGNVVLLIPVQDPWLPLMESLQDFSEDFMDKRQQPVHQVREDLFG
jgi:antitoxin VapB